MKEIILNAMERNEKSNKVRNAGFVPGVLNGPGATSTSVKFEGAELNKFIAKHGTNAKLWVALGAEKEFGFIKEVQKHPVEDKVMHIAIQLVEKNQNVKMRVPVTFRGQSELENRLLQLQILKPEIEVEGQAALIPNEVVADISKKKTGENITCVDFHMPSKIKILDPEDEVYAIIKDGKRKFADNNTDDDAE